MNFKPTKWKVIGSIVATLIIFIYIEGSFKCGKPPCSIQESSILFSIIVLITIYIIWSLFEKSEKKRRK